MVVAVPYKDDKVFTPFDKAEQFKFYEVIGRRITDTMIVDSAEMGPYAKMRFMKQFATDVMLCESIEEEPLLILDDNGIMVYRNVKGEIDDAVYEFLINNLMHVRSEESKSKIQEHHHDHGSSCGHDHANDCSSCDSCHTCEDCSDKK